MWTKWAAPAALLSLAHFPGWATLQPQPNSMTAPKPAGGRVLEAQPFRPEDLVQLSDIGPMTSGPEPRAVTLSPDRKKIAFLIQRADPATNDYRLKVYVMPIRIGAAPILVDSGGELIRKTVIGIGGGMLNTGFPTTISPIWSKNGDSIFFLKRTNHSTQIWRARTDGSGSGQITHDAGDIAEFALAEGGNVITYASRRTDPARQASLRDEALRGYRYDARFVPLFASGPDAFPSKMKAVENLDLTTGVTTEASDAEKDFLEKATDAASARNSDMTSDHRTTRVIQDSDPVLDKPTQLYAQTGNGMSYRCVAATCSGATNVWWTRDRMRVRYLRREGWGDSETGIYEWAPGKTIPKRLYSTPDVLLDCQPIDEKLLCTREQSTVPRQIVIIDPVSGRVSVLFDPNPDFAKFALGRVERLHWRNAFGIETFGDLIYPANYVPSRAYPLIVVQYISRGFLRGGVGDEFPIQVFANNGYAVLSVQRPSATRLIPDATSRMELERRLLEGFKDRRSVLSAIENGVAIVVKRGIADPGRIGITGLSDGSSTVQFAAINSKIFKAGSVSGCCWDPFQDAFMGLGATAAFHQMGWPSIVENQSTFWDHMSLIKNSAHTAFPLLFQQSDDEFRGAVASFTALRQAGRPAALFVFPNEFHFKWQPAHKLAVYERNLRWFDFWLRGVGGGDEWK